MLTYHMYNSKKKAGFHHLAKSFLNNGYNVTFCTVENSILDILAAKSNKRERYLTTLYSIAPKSMNGLTISSYLSLISPIKNTQTLNPLFQNIYMKGYSKVLSFSYDIVIFESTNGLFLFDKFKKNNPNAKFIYRVSDDLELVNGTKEIISHENSILPKFDLISTPSLSITKKLKLKSPKIKIITQYHGIEKEIYEKKYLNPYDQTKKNFVFVGTGFMDDGFLKIAADINSNWVFHIIGNLPQPVISQNIIYYGEMLFDETIPYLKHADVGLQIRSNSKGIETLEKSLKFIQYTYVQLPIIAPKYMNLKDSHVFSYEHTKESIVDAINKALSFNRELVDRSTILSWNEIAEEMLMYVVGSKVDSEANY